MKKLKLFLCVALFGAMSFGVFSAYDHLTMSEEERFLLSNVEALTTDEPGWVEDWWDSKIYYCNPIKVWRTKYVQYKDVPKDLWEYLPTGPIDPNQWGWLTYQEDDFDCIPGDRVAHCWEC